MPTPGSVADTWERTRERRWHGALGDPAPSGPRAYRAARLIDGTGASPIEDAVVRTDGRTITYAGPADDDPGRAAGDVVDLGDRTLMPGLIDCHAHPGSYPPTPVSPDDQEWAGARETVEAAASAYRALMSGVTTMRIPGLPGNTAFALRDAVVRGLLPGPRLLVAGRVICATGGHGHVGGEEADGPEGVRVAARRMFRSGADFLKLTATGGGTAGTLRTRATYSVEELAAAALAAAQRDTYATVHVHATEGIERCLDAGIQMLEHVTFVGDDGLEHFDPGLAARIRDANVPVVPTVQVNGRIVEREGFDAFVQRQDPAEQAQWIRRRESFRRRVELVHQLHEAGVVVLMGSDGGGRPAPIDDLAYGLELHVRAGIDPMTVILSATSVAATRLGLGDVTGSLVAGRSADVIAVAGDPITSIAAVGSAEFVMARGEVVRAPVAA